MAIAKCRECGTEVSDQAKVCPKCGIAKPVKKTSLLVKLIAGIFGLAILGNVVGNLGGGSSSSGSGSTTSPARTIDPKEQALGLVKLEKWDWNKGGFDSIMMLNATIKNDGTRDVKDVEIECRHASNRLYAV